MLCDDEFAGEVVAVGDACKKIKVGDRVVANVETFCGECFFCEQIGRAHV